MSRVRPCRALSGAEGFTRHAAISARGYSQTPEKISGASSALNAPPRTPPREREEVELGESARWAAFVLPTRRDRPSRRRRKQPRCNASISGSGSMSGNPGAAVITSGISSSGSTLTMFTWRNGGWRANARMKVSRYSISGITHSSGADAISAVMCVVTPSNSEDGNERQRRPRQTLAQTGGDPPFPPRHVNIGPCAAHGHGVDAAIPTAQGTEAAGPKRRLPVERHRWLDQQRICEQRQKTTSVAHGIQEVGIARGLMVDVGEPALQQRRGRRNGEHRRTGYQRQAEQQPQGR